MRYTDIENIFTKEGFNPANHTESDNICKLYFEDNHLNLLSKMIKLRDAIMKRGYKLRWDSETIQNQNYVVIFVAKN